MQYKPAFLQDNRDVKTRVHGIRSARWLACVGLTAMLALTGCGGDETKDTSSTSTKADTSATDIASTDITEDTQTVVDVTTDSETPNQDGTVGTDGSADSDSTGGGDTTQGCPFATNPAAGEPGAKCASATDCNSGLCIDTADGKVCTAQCTSCCPSGWTCTQMSDTDPTFACLPKSLHLCEPCTEDANCSNKAGTSLCVDYGDAGRFCGSTCAADGDCPSGYTCKDSKGTKGEAKQCIKTDLTCACSVKGIEAGATTDCTVTNTFGACKGSRKCGATGLQACSAKTPASESCNGEDDDCDGETDEGCDDDKDGYCDVAMATKDQPASCPKGGGDCADDKAEINPGVNELCGNSVDDNCNGNIDTDIDADSCVKYYTDSDKDGFGTGDAKCLCAPVDLLTATVAGDCADEDADVNPGKAEVCNNGKDDNCSGALDEENAQQCEKFWVDGDADGFGAGDAKCLCAPSVTYTTKKDGDCDDADAKLNPAQAEQCNGIDDNCSGKTDEQDALGCKTLYADTDKDGFGDPNASKCLCGAEGDYNAPIAEDCNDSKAEINPNAQEACSTGGVDDNCNGQTDETDAKGCVVYYNDVDKDGAGDPAVKSCMCAPQGDMIVTTGLDCNDNNPEQHPGVDEKCATAGVDDDCDGATDEENATGCGVWQYDGDGDGFGDGVQSKSKCLCVPGDKYTSDKTSDCNDNSAAINPAATELCGNNIDDNCNSQTDEENAQGCSMLYMDVDKDGFGSIAAPAKCLCKGTDFYTAPLGGDCNDAEPGTYPNAPEFCDGGKDTNCNNVGDDVGASGCVVYYFDGDGDNFGVDTDVQCLCAPSGKYTTTKNKDCDDTTIKVNPIATEVCSNNIDDDCNGKTDVDSLNALNYYQDEDGDGYGVGAAKTLCAPEGLFKALQAGDCNDTNGQIYPGQKDICNGFDDDCNNVVDNPGSADLCANVAESTNACVGGSCQLTCSANYFNADNVYANGCECKADNYAINNQGRFCTAPVALGNISDAGGQLATVSGNITPGDTGDWYSFTAVDNDDIASVGDKFALNIVFTSNPDNNFVFDVYRGGCSNAVPFCTGVNQHQWLNNYYGATPTGVGVGKNTPGGAKVPSPTPEKGGEGKCTASPGAFGMNICTNNTQAYVVRVYRKDGAPNSCSNYSLKISNN